MRYPNIPESDVAHSAAVQALRDGVPADAVAHPAPSVTSRDPMPDRWVYPDPVLNLAQTAREAGWTVRLTYARGHGVHATTMRPTAEKHSVAVRMTCPRGSAVAVYVTPVARRAWSWESLWAWDASGFTRLATLGALMEHLTGD